MLERHEVAATDGVGAPKRVLVALVVVEDARLRDSRSSGQHLDAPVRQVEHGARGIEGTSDVRSLPDIDKSAGPVLQLLPAGAQRQLRVLSHGQRNVCKDVLQRELVLVDRARATLASTFQCAQDLPEDSESRAEPKIRVQRVALQPDTAVVLRVSAK